MRTSHPKAPIIEVYDNNFVKEIKRLGALLESYPYIGMDTEFPGTVYPCPNYSQGFYYKYIKINVDKLKLIQLGITLFNEKGETPPEGSTWQFNLRFNHEKEPHSADSISMLTHCGIDFSQLSKKGIHYSTFSEYFIISGLILNDQVKWISFNGLSDFAYLLRLVINSNLPENENDFLSTLNIYFPTCYDIKILLSNSENLKGGLNKIAQQLGVDRIGEIHQAGSDSILTGEVFFKILKSSVVSRDEILKKKNIIFGVGIGADENETFYYTQFAPEANLGSKQMLSSYNYDNNYYNHNHLYQNPQGNFYDQNSKYPFQVLMTYN